MSDANDGEEEDEFDWFTAGDGEGSEEGGGT